MNQFVVSWTRWKACQRVHLSKDRLIALLQSNHSLKFHWERSLYIKKPLRIKLFPIFPASLARPDNSSLICPWTWVTAKTPQYQHKPRRRVRSNYQMQSNKWNPWIAHCVHRKFELKFGRVSPCGSNNDCLAKPEMGLWRRCRDG
jgi:hypothetical protein